VGHWHADRPCGECCRRTRPQPGSVCLLLCSPFPQLAVQAVDGVESFAQHAAQDGFQRFLHDVGQFPQPAGVVAPDFAFGGLFHAMALRRELTGAGVAARHATSSASAAGGFAVPLRRAALRDAFIALGYKVKVADDLAGVFSAFRLATIRPTRKSWTASSRSMKPSWLALESSGNVAGAGSAAARAMDVVRLCRAGYFPCHAAGPTPSLCVVTRSRVDDFLINETNLNSPPSSGISA
jgi:hypothetical protein